MNIYEWPSYTNTKAYTYTQFAPKFVYRSYQQHNIWIYKLFINYTENLFTQNVQESPNDSILKIIMNGANAKKKMQ